MCHCWRIVSQMADECARRNILDGMVLRGGYGQQFRVRWKPKRKRAVCDARARLLPDRTVVIRHGHHGPRRRKL